MLRKKAEDEHAAKLAEEEKMKTTQGKIGAKVNQSTEAMKSATMNLVNKTKAAMSKDKEVVDPTGTKTTTVSQANKPMKVPEIVKEKARFEDKSGRSY